MEVRRERRVSKRVGEGARQLSSAPAQTAFVVVA